MQIPLVRTCLGLAVLSVFVAGAIAARSSAAHPAPNGADPGYGCNLKLCIGDDGSVNVGCNMGGCCTQQTLGSYVWCTCAGNQQPPSERCATLLDGTTGGMFCVNPQLCPPTRECRVISWRTDGITEPPATCVGCSCTD